MEKINNMNVVP